MYGTWLWENMTLNSSGGSIVQCGTWLWIDFQDGGHYGAILLPVSDRVTSLFFVCQFLSANQISQL